MDSDEEILFRRDPGSSRGADGAKGSSGEAYVPFPQNLPPFSSGAIPGGVTCLIQLDQLGIAHQHLKRIKGVNTPVRITGTIGGVLYRPMSSRRSLVCDCRLALALYRAAPFFLNLDIDEVHFSSAYSYRYTAGGSLSRHARGLALDIHRIKRGQQLLIVEYDYAHALVDGCHPESPTLNQLACQLLRWGMFDRVLTPDFDRGHYNHFHLSIEELHHRRSGSHPSPVIEGDAD